MFHLIKTWIVVIASNNSFGDVLADKLLFLDVAHYYSCLYINNKNYTTTSKVCYHLHYTLLMMCHVQKE